MPAATPELPNRSTDMTRSTGSLDACKSSRRKGPQQLVAIVLNHRTLDDTCRAVASLAASRRCPDRIIVVDNDTADECRVRFSGPEAQSVEPRAQGLLVSYLHTGQNLGFSGGMNVGIRAALEAGADLVLLVNSDVVVAAECLEHLEAALVEKPAVGIVGPLVLSRAPPDRVASAGLSYNERNGRMRVLDAGVRAADVVPFAREVDAVSGCLMLVRREAFERVGLLDERFFFGFEDLEFCLRAREDGLGTLVVGSAVAYHEEARSIGRASARRFYFAARNHLLVASREHRDEGAGARACRLSWVAILNLVHAITATAGSRAGRLVATLRGIRDFLNGRFGEDPPA